MICEDDPAPVPTTATRPFGNKGRVVGRSALQIWLGIPRQRSRIPLPCSAAVKDRSDEAADELDRIVRVERRVVGGSARDLLISLPPVCRRQLEWLIRCDASTAMLTAERLAKQTCVNVLCSGYQDKVDEVAIPSARQSRVCADNRRVLVCDLI